MKTDKPIPTTTTIELDPAVFESYVGKYELAAEFYLNIFSQEDTMYIQATGQQKHELVATALNQFTLKDTDIKITVNVNEANQVSSLTLHQNGDHEAKKLD
jgi:predicted 3-demethylubiquinone-9 3-methyltransferase (glyoxalase superfamily)